MTDSGDRLLLTAVLILVPLLDVVATAFFIRLYRRSRQESEEVPPQSSWWSRLLHRLLVQRSWLLLLMTFTSAVITGVYVLFGALVLRRTLGMVALDWGPAASIVALVLLGLIPLLTVTAFWVSSRVGKER